MTCRSYGHDLLRWFRLLWAVDVGWEQATETEASALDGWLRTARNPQRHRRREGSLPPGSVNPKTGKVLLGSRLRRAESMQIRVGCTWGRIEPTTKSRGNVVSRNARGWL